jgi:hypothetical protein
MGLLRRNSPIADAEREVADLERRRARLADQLQHSEAELTAAVTERRKQMVEADEDNGADGRVEINRLRDRVAELGEAIGEIDNRIAAAKGKLASERDMIKRKAEAGMRLKQAEALESARDAYSSALAQLIAALEPAAGASLLAGAAITALAGHRAGVGPCLEAVVQELRAYAGSVVDGGLPMRPQPAPVEPPPPPPPAIERRSVFLRYAGCWPEGDEIKTSGPHTTPELPIEIAEQALSYNHAVEVHSQAAADLRAIMDPGYGVWPADRCTDLTKPKPLPKPSGEQTVTAPSIHSGFTPPRKAIIGTAIAR